MTVDSDGTVWFGLLRRYAGGEYWKVGRITAAGDLAEYRLRNGSMYYSFAAGPEDRVWFPSTFGRGYLRAINSIGVTGRIGEPICADPTCALEPTGIAAGPDGSIWYGLRRPNLNMGGGGSGQGIENEIANEAGLIAHFVP